MSSISSVNSTPTTNTSLTSTAQTNQAKATAASTSEETQERKLTGYEQSQLNKKQLNASIMQSHMELSSGKEDNSLKLLYKTALEGINKALEEDFGPNAAQKIKQSEVDTSAEATAERIVSFATAFYHKYKEQNPNLSEEERLDKFLAIVGGGVDKGFGDARNILDGLGVLSGKVEKDIDSTYSLIQDGFAKFRETILNAAKEQELAADVASNTTSELTR